MEIEAQAAPPHEEPAPDGGSQRTGEAGRAAAAVRWISLAVLLAGGLAVLRALPLAQAGERLEAVVSAMGALGMLVFGIAYVVFALAFLPASALTLAAGALFGLGRGVAIVSLSSATAAALAFLIARHLARARVEALAARHPRFGALDAAIAKGGWRVIALLRLSPAVPFSAGNYLFGLTGVRFWPYALASWVFMLPGTFLYVYLGYLGRAGLAGGTRTPGEWALLAVGLLATVMVTVYVSKLARQALAQTTPGTEAPATAEREPVEERTSSPSVLLPALAILAALAGSWAQSHRPQLAALLGPPRVTPREAYPIEGTGFDHGAFQALLAAHVETDGAVDYPGLRADAAGLDRYLAGLEHAPFAALGRDEKLALLINAYNAFTLRLVLDHWPVDSIKNIPAAQRWDARRWKLAGSVISLNQLEHEWIRRDFAEPRVHFALVCAARGCPPLRSEAYTGERLQAQLEDQTRRVHGSRRWLWLEGPTLHLTALYDWYRSDFERSSGKPLLDYVAQHAPEVARARQAGMELRLSWLPYDWALNAKEMRP